MIVAPENTLESDFKVASGEAVSSRKPPPSPFSLRLTEEERSRLTDEAAGAPLGTYMRAKLLQEGMASIRRRHSGHRIEDRQALARALALLGKSRLASNLNQLAHAAHLGTLPYAPEIEAELLEAVAAIRDIRRLLLEALGLKAGETP